MTKSADAREQITLINTLVFEPLRAVFKAVKQQPLRLSHPEGASCWTPRSNPRAGVVSAADMPENFQQAIEFALLHQRFEFAFFLKLISPMAMHIPRHEVELEPDRQVDLEGYNYPTY